MQEFKRKWEEKIKMMLLPTEFYAFKSTCGWKIMLWCQQFCIVLFKVIFVFGKMWKAVTTLQSIMNTKLSKQRFWHCHENGLIKTIKMIPHKLYASFKLTSLYCGLRIILVYPNPGKPTWHSHVGCGVSFELSWWACFHDRAKAYAGWAWHS